MALRGAFVGRVALLSGIALAILVSPSCKTSAPPAPSPSPTATARIVVPPTVAPPTVVPPAATAVPPSATPTSVPATPTPPSKPAPKESTGSGRSAVAPTRVPMRITPAPTPAPTAAVPAATPVQTGTLSGKIELLGPDKKVVPAQDAVIWLPGVPAPQKAAAKPTLKSQDKRFEPHVVVVTKGSTVTFPNVDKIYHNVFSRTEGSEFDLGLYRGGASKDNRFDKPGLVRVFCNIHPQMAGYVMVLDDVPHALTDERGAFVLAGIPPGKHSVRLWHEKGGERTVEVEVRPGVETKLATQLDGSGFKVVPHKNKLGQDYPKGRDDERY